MVERIKSSLENLYTGYFAAVMATGIVSIALLLKGFAQLSMFFFVITVVLYVILLGAYSLRLVFFRDKVWKDMTNAAKVFGYFTIIAGTDVLGTRFAFAGQYRMAMGLGLIGVVAWMFLMYFILLFLIFYNEEPVQKVINGGWLITTVSVESLAALSSALADFLPADQGWLLFVAYAFWSLGILVYLIFISIIMYRFFFFSLSSKDLTPPYWINMGAMAITTLAGSRLILYPHATSFLVVVMPFVEGFTIMLWVFGTWWIPLLVLIGIWKYIVYREAFKYDPALWSIVFPLGMYTAASETLGRIKGLALVHGIVDVGLWVAVAAWSLVVLSFIIGLPQQRKQAQPRTISRVS